MHFKRSVHWSLLLGVCNACLSIATFPQASGTAIETLRIYDGQAMSAPCMSKRRQDENRKDFHPTNFTQTELNTTRLLDLPESIRLPVCRFTYYWTLSSKFFATFPHGTCLLSVWWKYLALAGVYLLIWFALSSKLTLSWSNAQPSNHRYGPSTHYGSPCQGNLR